MQTDLTGTPSRARLERKPRCWTPSKAGVRPFPLFPILLGLTTVLSACASESQRYPVKGEINGHEIATTVDAYEAKYYLERYLSEKPGPSERESTLDEAFEDLPNAKIDRKEYKALSARFSTDLATLHLIKQLSEVPENRKLQTAYWREVEALRAISAENGPKLHSCFLARPGPLFMFVPGWLYQSNPATGSDFAEQRRLLTAIGLETQLVATKENGSIEGNAHIIADRLRSVGQDVGPTVIISASKAGPEVAHAIGHLLSAEESTVVKAWINVGGLLKGSPLADWGTDWPNHLIVSLYFAFKDLDIRESLPSMTTARSLRRWRKERIPGHIKLVNFVAVPLSGQVTPMARFGYARTSKAGPSDGLTTIIDELAHGGATVLEVGLDHYFKDPEIHLKTVALALTVIREVLGPIDMNCLPPVKKAAVAQSDLDFP